MSILETVDCTFLVKERLLLTHKCLFALHVRIASQQSHCPFVPIVPTEILAQGHVGKQLYEEALRDGSVDVYRGRILFIGQCRAGKTSLKKSLLGLPFDPKEQSTEGIEVDPSICEVEVEQVKNWNSTGENKPSLSEFCQDVSRMFAEKQYHWIHNKAKEDPEPDPEEDLSREEPDLKSTTDLVFQDRHHSYMNQVCTLKVCSPLFVKLWYHILTFRFHD